MKVGYMIVFTTLLLVEGSVLAASVIEDEEFDTALGWAYEQGMTKYDTQEDYQPLATLTREQGAKMLSVFAMQHLCMEPDKSIQCEFSDIDSADPTLAPYLVTACQLGLFKGYDGAFMPTATLTKAQALTVIMRAISGKQDEDDAPRWNAYYESAKQLGLTKEENVRALDVPISRYEALLLQWRVEGETCTEDNLSGDNSDDGYAPELIDVLEDLFGPISTPDEVDDEPSSLDTGDEQSDTETGTALTGA